MKKDFLFSTDDGNFQLHTICWLPDDRSPRAVLQLVHGISEHIERYDSFASFLIQYGIIVFGCDLPGHGTTAPGSEEYGYFADTDGWNLVSKALSELALAMKQSCLKLPFFLLGHSMGSFLVRTIIIRSPDLADGVILSGTGQPSKRFLRFVHTITKLSASLFGPKTRSKAIDHLIMGHYRRQFSTSHRSSNWISRDPAVVDRFIADPLCSLTPTISLFLDMLDGLTYIENPENLQSIRKELPIFIFSGDQDPVGENGTGVHRVIDALEAAGCDQIEYKLYPGGRHEMLNELNQQEVYDDILTWLNQQMNAD